MTTYRIISADSHVNPPTGFWREYLPAGLRDRAPVLETTPEGDFVLFEGKRTPFLMLGSLAGKKKEHFKLYGKIDETAPGGYDPQARLKDLAVDGIDAEVLFGGGPLTTQDPELELASYSAYNDWLADFCSAAPDRFLGMAYIPMEDVERASAETRRAIKKGLRGVVIPAVAPATPYADPAWDPYWDLLVDLGVMAHMHLGARPARWDSGAGFLINHPLTKVAMAEPIAYFIHQNIFDRHPELKLVTVESGWGWAPYVMHYMDNSWRNHRYWTESKLQEPPSFYFRRNVVGTFQDDPTAVRERHTIGLENMMWFSDYPHAETTWPDSRAVIDRQMGGVPEDERHQMVAGNAVRLYHLG
jgi:predicted TIM-barrel fold metal-dependent hydrolase